MSRPLVSLFVAPAVVGAVLLIAAPAQPPGGERPGGMVRTPFMTVLDTDDDGQVSADELANAPAALAKLDTNGDGRITADELRPPGGLGGGPPGGLGGGPPGGWGGGPPGGWGGGPPGAPRGGQAAEELVTRFVEYGENHDGKVSAAELPARMQGILMRADADKDGCATRDELLAMARTQSQGDGRREGGRADGGRGERGEIDRAFRGGNAAALIDRMIQDFDVDTDGKLSRDELARFASQVPMGSGGPPDGERRQGNGRDQQRHDGPGRRPPTD